MRTTEEVLRWMAARGAQLSVDRNERQNHVVLQLDIPANSSDFPMMSHRSEVSRRELDAYNSRVPILESRVIGLVNEASMELTLRELAAYREANLNEEAVANTARRRLRSWSDVVSGPHAVTGSVGSITGTPSASDQQADLVVDEAEAVLPQETPDQVLASIRERRASFPQGVVRGHTILQGSWGGSYVDPSHTTPDQQG